MVFVAVMDGKLKIAVERRGGHRLPHKTFMRPWDGPQFDLDQGHKERNTRCKKGAIGGSRSGVGWDDRGSGGWLDDDEAGGS